MFYKVSNGGTKTKLNVTCNQTFSASGVATQHQNFSFIITIDDGHVTISPQSTRKTYRAFDTNMNVDCGFSATVISS
jgi:hypothetical protein